MSEAEIWELILLSQANAATYIAMLLTLLSGYLVVAHLVGAKLTKQQIVIINLLFLSAAVWIAFPAFAAFERASFLLSLTSETYRSPRSAGMHLAPTASVVIFSGAILASLRFMWDVRDRKSPE
ncbi:MAG: hypothetical protein L7T24_09960 [Luminiphilus sp.]|nr:hypothetical protein [Luminiphilus sp.]